MSSRWGTVSTNFYGATQWVCLNTVSSEAWTKSLPPVSNVFSICFFIPVLSTRPKYYTLIFDSSSSVMAVKKLIITILRSFYTTYSPPDFWPTRAQHLCCVFLLWPQYMMEHYRILHNFQQSSKRFHHFFCIQPVCSYCI